MNYIGIDNGISGGIAMVRQDGSLRCFCGMKVQKTRKGNEVDVASTQAILEHWIASCEQDDHVTVVIEEPGGSKSAKAATSMAGAFHAMRALVELMSLRCLRITPQAWQKKMLNCKAGETKAVALQLAKSLWPAIDFKRTPACRTPDMGLVDAALIAEYARRERL